jgi:hypothetical protein
MSKQRKHKPIVFALLAGAVTMSIGTSAYAQVAGGMAVYDQTVNRTLRGISNIVSTVKSDLDAILKINQRINDNISEMYALLVKPTSSKGAPNAAKYYLQTKGLNNNTQLSNDIQNTTKSLTNLAGYGEFAPNVADPSKASPDVLTNSTASYNAANNYGNYSTTSVNSLLSSHAYNIKPGNVQLLLKGDPKQAKKIGSDQAKAALGFVQNVTLANQPIPAAGNSSDSPDAQKYMAYKKTIMSIQSIANDTLTNTLVSRLPYKYDASDAASKQDVLNKMNVEDSGNSSYWDPDKKGVGSQGLLPRALDFMTRFFSINYNLNNISKQLNRVNLQLAMLITQNTMLIQNNIGRALLTAAQESKPALKFKKEE